MLVIFLYHQISSLISYQIQVNNVPQICSPHFSHVPLSFQKLVSSAKEALDALFLPDDVLHYIQSKTPLLTQDQLNNAKIVGYVQYKLCFSCHLLNEEKEARVCPPLYMMTCSINEEPSTALGQWHNVEEVCS